MSITPDTREGGAGLPEGFVELPPQIYASEPMWIPEDPHAVSHAFGPDNPWFRQGEARAFCVPDRARLAVFIDASARVDGRQAAFFGFWETRGDLAVDTALFDAAAEWARARGAQDLYGPINFSTYGHYRLRLAAERDAVTFPDEPFNPAAYPALLKALGFDHDQTYLTQMGPNDRGQILRQYRQPARVRLAAAGYRFERLDHDTWLTHLPALHGIVDAIFAANFAYTPLTYAAFKAKCGRAFVERACPHTSVIVHGPQGDIAGFLLVYPHYGPLVVQAAGAARVNVNDLSYARHARALETHKQPMSAVAKTTGTSPNHRRKGLMTAMAVCMFEWAADRYAYWYAAIIRTQNVSRRYSDGYTDGERWYGLYRKPLD